MQPSLWVGQFLPALLHCAVSSQPLPPAHVRFQASFLWDWPELNFAAEVFIPVRQGGVAWQGLPLPFPGCLSDLVKQGGGVDKRQGPTMPCELPGIVSIDLGESLKPSG